jgi:hypothetical protein
MFMSPVAVALRVQEVVAAEQEPARAMDARDEEAHSKMAKNKSNFLIGLAQP